MTILTLHSFHECHKFTLRADTTYAFAKLGIFLSLYTVPVADAFHISETEATARLAKATAP